MDAAPVIAADRLTKYYGKTRGIEDLSFDVRAGEVFGFLGPNGAGKSTTIRTMLDFLRPTSGRVRVFGLDPGDEGPEIRRRVGYVPGEFGLYERLTGKEYLETFASFRRGTGRDGIGPLAERLDLDLSMRIRELSHGNRRKLALIQAFMHAPDLLVMDEPTQGLDPLMQLEFAAIVDEARARGATVFLSSHVLPEVERLCDRVAIIRAGRLVTVDDVGELKSKALRRVEFHFESPVGAERFASLASVIEAQAHGDTVAMTVRGRLDEVIKEAARHPVVNVETHEPSLEDVFLEAYRNDEEGRP